MSKISYRIRVFRRFLGLNQSDMSDLMGVSSGQFRRYEKGLISPPLDKIRPLVTKYNLNLNWLLTGEGEMLIADELHQDEARKRELEELRSELKKIATRLEELDARRHGRSDPGIVPG